MAVIKIQNRFLVVLKEEDIIKVQDVLQEKINSLIHQDFMSLTDEEQDALNREYADLGDLRAKFSGAYVVE